MCRDKQIRFAFISIIFALVICSGCRIALDTNAVTYEEPVGDPDIKVEQYVPAKAPWQVHIAQP